MTKIFGKDATQQDFDLLVEQLREATKEAGANPIMGGQNGKRIDAVKESGEISESQFDEIADRIDGLWEDSPGRLTIPEIRYFRSQVSRFGDFTTILSKYGYTEAGVFTALVQENPGRYQIADDCKTP